MVNPSNYCPKCGNEKAKCECIKNTGKPPPWGRKPKPPAPPKPKKPKKEH
jgi:hypothetical protein